jgi:hypothetical protein
MRRRDLAATRPNVKAWGIAPGIEELEIKKP